MKNKVLKLKEAAAVLGISVKTLQRLADAREVECVTNPYGWRRGITEEEVIRLKNKLLARAKKRKPAKPKPPFPKRETVPVKPSETNVAPKIPVAPEAPPLPTEIPMRQAVDMLTPSTIGERSVFRDLLSTATLLGSFTSQQLSEKTQYPMSIAETLCQRLVAKNIATKQNESFVLKVKIIG